MKAETLERVHKVLQTIDSALALNPAGTYLTGGDKVTLADVCVYFSTTIGLLFAEQLDLKQYSHFHSWHQRVDEALRTYDQDGFFQNGIARMRQLVSKFRESQQK